MKKFNLGVKIAIPISLFLIANISNAIVNNAIAGVMTILVIAMYVFESIKDK